MRFKKKCRNGTKSRHEYINDFLDSDIIANVYFTSDVDAKNRVRSLNEYNKINLNEMRRTNMQMMEFSTSVKTVILMLKMMLRQLIVK